MGGTREQKGAVLRTEKGVTFIGKNLSLKKKTWGKKKEGGRTARWALSILAQANNESH